MKPAFALSLSFDGIALLHRCAGGWRLAGEVALDVPDLGIALAGLRETAARLEPAPLTTKLIIPNDQIRFLSIDTGMADARTRGRRVREALDGATPYAIDDLVYDISIEGTTTHIAAVARDTLAEAEAFAVEHQFNPLSFVAIPGDKPFLGEPFFGATRHAASLLPPEQKVEADGVAVVVVGRAVIPPPETDPETDPESNPGQEPVSESVAPPPAVEIPAAEPAPTIGFSSRRSKARILRTPVDPTPTERPKETQKSTTEPLTASRPSPADQTPPRSTPPVAPPPAAAAPPRAPAAPTLADPSAMPKKAAEARIAPVALRPETATATAPLTVPGKAAPARGPVVTPLDPEDDIPPIPDGVAGALRATAAADVAASPPETAPRAGFLSRRRTPKPSATPMPPRLAGAIGKTTPTEPAAAVANETDRMTVFGARNGARDQGKPRYLGLILTAALLLFLAGIAAWASIFLDDTLSRLFGRSNPTEIASDPETAPGLAPEAVSVLALQPAPTAPTPPETKAESKPETGAETGATTPEVPTGEPAAAPDVVQFALPRLDAPTIGPDSALNDPIGAEQPIRLTSLDPNANPLTETDAAVAQALRVPRTTGPGARPAPLLDANSSPETIYAATGIWPQAPVEPETPSVITLDGLFIGSIDNRDLSKDAVALLPVAMLDTDRPFGAPAAPLAEGPSEKPGTGELVTATPEGTQNPDGVMIYLGRPPLVPPPTPTRFGDTPETLPEAVAQAEAEAARARLAKSRPRARPAGFAERVERNRLGGLTLQELAARRPRARPDRPATATPEEPQTGLSTATAQAIATSRRPSMRPANFASRIAARQSPTRTASTEPARREDIEPDRGPVRNDALIASVAPRTVEPTVPSPSLVTRQATVKNAINLRKINLVGVYGTPTNRRALVRLPSGRYKKVKIGDNIDGGKVVAIGDSELRYQKGGRSMVLKVPSG